MTESSNRVAIVTGARWHNYERWAEKYQLQQGKIDQIIADYVG